MYFEFHEQPQQGATWTPTVDVCERPDEIVIFVEMPGVQRSDVQLAWNGLGEPFCFAQRPENSSTGSHYMPSVFVGCESATITVNGRVLPGKPVAREAAGHSISTALLAFCESWIRV